MCERLRNQLAGDYLREGSERYGVFLLIRQENKPEKKWKVDGKLTDISTLQETLRKYWIRISSHFPRVSDIQMIVLDLTIREAKSDS